MGIHCQNIALEFGIEKCTMLIMKNDEKNKQITEVLKFGWPSCHLVGGFLIQKVRLVITRL